jgi:hypothetical protein
MSSSSSSSPGLCPTWLGGAEWLDLLLLDRDAAEPDADVVGTGRLRPCDKGGACVLQGYRFPQQHRPVLGRSAEGEDGATRRAQGGAAACGPHRSRNSRPPSTSSFHSCWLKPVTGELWASCFQPSIHNGGIASASARLSAPNDAPTARRGRAGCRASGAGTTGTTWC